ncbi:MAG: hypothetical protein ACOC80_12375, partial [Petrotogales bacterium]
TLTSEHIIHQLFKTAADYARNAVELDRANQFEKAIKFYISAAEHLQKILELEKNEKMRDLYYRKARLYLMRAKELKGPIEEGEAKISEEPEEILPSVTKMDEMSEELLPSVSEETGKETDLPSSDNIQELLKKSTTYANKAEEYKKSGQLTDAVSNYLSAAEVFQKLYELTKEKEYFTRAKEFLVMAKESRYTMVDRVDPLAQEISDLIYDAYDVKKKLKEKMKPYDVKDSINIKEKIQRKELPVSAYEDYLSILALERKFKELLSQLDIYLAELQEKPVTEKEDSVSIKERYDEYAKMIRKEAQEILHEPPLIFLDRIEVIFVDNSHLEIRYPTDSEYSFYWSKDDEIFNVNNIVSDTITSPESTPKENIKNFLNEIRKKIGKPPQ